MHMKLNRVKEVYLTIPITGIMTPYMILKDCKISYKKLCPDRYPYIVSIMITKNNKPVFSAKNVASLTNIDIPYFDPIQIHRLIYDMSNDIFEVQDDDSTCRFLLNNSLDDINGPSYVKIYDRKGARVIFL